MFVTKFLNSTTQRKNSNHLINVVHGKNESLKNYLTRFNKESLMVKDLEPSFTLAALNSGLRDNSLFTFSPMKKPTHDMTDLLRRVEKYVNVEEGLATRKHKTSWFDQQEKEEHSRRAPGKKQERKERPELTKDDLRHKLSKNKKSPKMGTPIPSYNNFAPMLETQTRILAVEKDKVPIQWPVPLRSPTKKRDSTKYC
ncbi:hypothetical protein CFOL_v3_00133 [Cephalotus follicularis]|uniref:Retrotransposon gag domain-containing protein n=1 Tax=Cephalotus follicularis TaxID=3775 RepID=A0A1Q3ALH1_CEPFO|nr:hypothetical protein CFOL_v3_00133 [Cephalotus follicularis]